MLTLYGDAGRGETRSLEDGFFKDGVAGPSAALFRRDSISQAGGAEGFANEGVSVPGFRDSS
jgi:hypothetical protein